MINDPQSMKQARAIKSCHDTIKQCKLGLIELFKQKMNFKPQEKYITVRMRTTSNGIPYVAVSYQFKDSGNRLNFFRDPISFMPGVQVERYYVEKWLKAKENLKRLKKGTITVDELIIEKLSSDQS